MNPDPSREVTQTANDLDATIRVDVRATLPPGLEQPGDMIDRYKLLELLGEGGFGSVWRAEQFEPIHREVALKVIKAGMDSREIIARFAAERQALAMMDHPNIAAVLDAGTTEGGRPFFVMELVKGVPLTEFCDGRNLTIRQRLELFIPVCQAVQHAHQKAILHRDLKPSNILVVEVDGKAAPKVIDFGIAKALGGAEEQAFQASLARTQAGMIIGTPQYMSPEQAGAEPDLDTRSDIYTLGVILYELLVGDTPLGREQMRKAAMDEIMRLVREADAKRPSSRLLPASEFNKTLAKERQSNPEKLSRMLRGDLDWIVLKALEKERGRRFASAAELAEDIKRHLHNEVVQARRPGRAYVIGKFIRRNRLPVAAAVVVMLSLVAALSFSIYSGRKERLARQEADTAVKRQMQMLQEASMNAVNVAHEQVRNGSPHVALAYAAKALEFDPENKFAAAEIYSLLAYEPEAQAPWPLRELKTQPGFIHEVGFTPDGWQVVTSSSDKTVRFWNVMTDIQEGEALTHDSSVGLLSFSPDGKWLATGCVSGAVRVWDWPARKLHVQVPEKHAGSVTCLAWSRDSRLLASGGDGKQARIWDAAVAKPLSPWLQHEARLNSLAFSPDAKSLAAGPEKGGTVIWSVETGQMIAKAPKLSDRTVRLVRFNQDGTNLVAGSSSFVYQSKPPHTEWSKDLLNDKRTGNSVTEYRVSPDGGMLAVNDTKGTNVAPLDDIEKMSDRMSHRRDSTSSDFSPDSRWIMTASNDGTARLWDVSTTKPRGAPAFIGRPVTKIRLSPDGRHFLTKDKDSRVMLWSLPLFAPRGDVFWHSSTVQTAALSPDGRTVITGDMNNGNAWLWDASTLKQHPTQPGLDYPVMRVGFSQDGRRYYTACSNGTLSDYVQVWNSSDGKPAGPKIRHLGIRSYSALIWPETTRVAPVFDRAGGRLLVRAAPDTAQLMDVTDGTPASPPFRHEAALFHAAFSPDESKILTTGENGIAKIWDARSGKELHRLDPNNKLGAILHGTFTPSGEVVVLASHGANTGAIWNLYSPNQKCLRLPHDLWVMDAACTPDGKLVATASIDFSARLWDAATGTPVTSRLEHDYHALRVEFSKDGKWLITSGPEGAARIFAVPSGRPVGDPLKHQLAANAWDRVITVIQFGANHDLALTASRDNTARLWHLPPWDEPAPSWLGLLSALISGTRIGADNLPVSLPPDERIALRAHLISLPPQNTRWDRLRRWVLSVETERRLSPESGVTLNDYVTSCLIQSVKQGMSLAAWQSMTGELHRLHPSHPLMPLALAVAEQDAKLRAFHQSRQQAQKVPDALLQAKEMLHAALTLAQANDGTGEDEATPQEHAMRALLGIMNLVLGTNHPWTLHIRQGLASFLFSTGKVSASENELRPLLADRMRTLGESHADTLLTRGWLVSTLGHQGKFEQAEDECRGTLEICEGKLGPDHIQTLYTRMQLGLILGHQTKYTEALALVKRAEADFAKTFGSENENTKRATETRMRLEAILMQKTPETPKP